MGLDLAVSALWIRKDHPPDWEAAEDALRALPLATVWGTRDDHFPWESWLEGAPDPPAPLGVYQGIRSAQSHLRDALEEAREAVERGTHNVTKIDLPQHTVFAAGCVTSGDTPPDPWQGFADFGEGGLASAAGFEGWTRYCTVRLEKRVLDFERREIRSVAATRALMFAEDLAREAPWGVGSFDFEPPTIWPVLWLDPLRAVLRARREERLLRALMLFAGRTFGLLEALFDLDDGSDESRDDIENGSEDIPPVVHELADLLDASALPRRRSIDVREVFRDTLADARTVAEQYLPLLAGEGDRELAEQLQSASGSSLSRSVGVEISAHLFAPLLVAIGDLADERLAQIAEPEQHRLSRYRWSAGRVVHPSYDNYLGWCAARSLDLDAAHSAVETIENPGLREQMRADLERLGGLARNEYSRLVTYEDVGDLRLWFTADTWRDGWTLNEPLRRLGKAGVLKAAGAVAWSRPIESD